MTERRQIDSDEYTGPDRRRRRDPHPPRFADSLHLSPQFALAVVASLFTVAAFIYGMRGDVSMNANGIKLNTEAIKYETSERKIADSLAMDRATRAEDESRRAFLRMSDKLDEVKDLIIENQRKKAAAE